MEQGGGGERYTIEFQVLRPSAVSNPVQCYSLVGSNRIQGRRPNNRCIVFNVSVVDQFIVQPGDVVGFFSDNTERNDNDNGVQVDRSRTDVTAFYRLRNTIPTMDQGSCLFAIGPNQIDTSTMAAPVITAVVGKL